MNRTFPGNGQRVRGGVCDHSVQRASLLLLFLVTLSARKASAEGSAGPTPAGAPTPSATPNATPVHALSAAETSPGYLAVAPPGPRRDPAFVEVGAALTLELLTSSGALCSGSSSPCVLGSGGGLRVGAGYRFASPLYLGGAYEVSKHDASKLLRLPIMQQLRFEVRYMLDTTHTYEPYLVAEGGAAGYGSDWRLDSLGPLGALGLGVQIELSRTAVFAIESTYRLIRLSSFVDPAGELRPSGSASFLGFDVALEQRSPVGD